MKIQEFVTIILSSPGLTNVVMIANRRVVSDDSTIHGHGSLPSYSQDCWRCVHGGFELASLKQDYRITNLSHLFRNRPFWNWSGTVKTLVLLEHFLCWNTDTKSKKSLPLTLSRSSLLSSLWCRSSLRHRQLNYGSQMCAAACDMFSTFAAYPGFLSVTHGPYFRCFWFFKGLFFFPSFLPSSVWTVGEFIYELRFELFMYLRTDGYECLINLVWCCDLDVLFMYDSF